MKAIDQLGITAPFPSQTPEHMADALGIQPKDRVLDVGGGGAPLTRANVIVDRDLKGGADRDGLDAPIDGRWLAGDIHALPFADKSFDFVYCCHVLEHTQNPARACEELMRVAQRGYIETPRRLTEMLHGHPTHRWLVDVIDGVLIFERRMFIESPLRNVMLARLLTDPEAFQAYLIKQRHLTCVQFTWSNRFDYMVIEPPDWQQAFDYDNRCHAGWSHYYFALNLLANQAPTGYVHNHIQQARTLLPNEGLPAALACAEALLNDNLLIAKENWAAAKQLGCADACLLEYEAMLARPLPGSAIPLPGKRDELAANRNDDGQIANFYRILNERNEQLAGLSQAVTERDRQIIALLDSTSWKITQPLRFISRLLKYIRRAGNQVSLTLKRNGGLTATSKKATELYRSEGLGGLWRAIKRFL